MFGKKEKNSVEVPKPITARIETMPGAFYGGADPIIYPHSEQKSVVNISAATVPIANNVPKVPVPQQKLPITPPATQKVTLQKPEVLPPSSNKKKLFFVLLIVFLIVAGIGYFVYLRFTAPKTTGQNNGLISAPTSSFIASPPIISVVSPTTTESEIPVVTTTPTSTPLVRGGGVLTLPSVSYASSVDDDADGLTTREEESFLTDPEVWDTDNDGYYDSLEVKNLYNPKGIAPQKIIDSGLVREYINPVYQYRFYYPSGWRVDTVGQDFGDILVSSDTGDYIEIRVFPKETSLNFSSWFSSFLPGENFLSLNSMTNRFQVPFYKRADNQVGFFETPTAVYSIIYFYGQEKNLFPNVMEVLLQSFRVSNSGFDLPVQPVLPGIIAPSSSSSSVESSFEIVPASSSTTSSLQNLPINPDDVVI